MHVEIRYFEGCPNWTTSYDRLLEALRLDGHVDVELQQTRVETPEQAERLGFVGSPSVLIDGRDPFARGDESVGLACRVFQTPAGLAGSPTVEQLRDALT